MDEGDAIRRYELLACQSLQFDQCVLGFVGAATGSSDESSCCNRNRPFGELVFNMLKFSERDIKSS